MLLDQDRNRDRLKSAAGVAAFHALLGYALITGLGFQLPAEITDKLAVFDVVEPPPPPPVEKPVPAKVRVEEPEGAASPPSMKANPTPIVAPPPVIELKVPPPVVSIPEPTPVPDGTAATAGVAAIPGPGTGTGGEGNGTGAGGQGSGTGGGGAPARWISGRIMDSDYPRAAVRARASGTVFLSFVVAPNGRVSDCRVTRSSGNRALDETTCALIVRRFRYRPAIDFEGRPIAQTIRGEHVWELGAEPDPIEIEPTEIDDDQA